MTHHAVAQPADHASGGPDPGAGHSVRRDRADAFPALGDRWVRQQVGEG